MAEQPLWAPWRMEYILGPKNKTQCVFCAYAQNPPEKHAEDLTLCKTSLAYVCLNRFPFAAGHLLIIPKIHKSSPLDLSQDEYVALFDLVKLSIERLQKAVKPQGLNVGINLGEAAGAGIAEHLHVHIVPRWSGDTNFMPVVASTRVMPQALHDTWAHLRPYFSDIS